MEVSRATSECPFLLEPMPALAWSTGPQKALPVSLATPTPPPCSVQAPWMDRRSVAGRMQGGAPVCPPHWGGAAVPTALLHLLQGSSGAFCALVSCCGARLGLWHPRFVHIFTQTVHTRCVHEVTLNHECCQWRPQSPEGHHHHSMSLQARRVLPFTVPGLWSYPLPFPVHLSGRGRGGAQKGGVSVCGATDIPRLGQITEAASFQGLEPPVLTPCPKVGQLA